MARSCHAGDRVGRWQSEAEAPPRDLGLFKASLETAEKGELSGKVRPLYPLAFVQGCRAVAYAHSLNEGKPDLFANDPQCWVDD